MKQLYAGQPLDLPALIRRVKAAVRIEDEVRRRGVELAGGGTRLEGHCPLPGHEDDRPSFSVYTSTQRYYCFGCESGGDVIDFVQHMDACSFLEACARLLGEERVAATWLASPGERRAPQSHLPAPLAAAPDRVAEPEVVRTPEHTDILTRAMLHYHRTILRSPFALDYLASRGTRTGTVKRCLLGYADGSFRLTLLGKPHLWRAAEEVGLLTATGREWLTGRLVIPEIVAGQCTWLIGRVLPEPVPQRVLFANRKYLGLPLDKPLLGYGRALALLSATPRPAMLGIHIVEGAIDYVITQEWSLPFYNLSPLGTHVSRRQLQCLLYLHQASGGVPFVLNLDGDERGGIGTLHLLEQLRGYPALVTPSVAQGKDLGRLAELPGGYGWFLHALGATGEGGAWL